LEKLLWKARKVTGNSKVFAYATGFPERIGKIRFKNVGMPKCRYARETSEVMT
jgi:hypothetical protein